ncbi:MAG: alpha/beta hydrolase [Bacteriovoracia bacterium]
MAFTFIHLLFWICVFIVWAQLVKAMYSFEDGSDETHYVRLDPNWRIALSRWLPQGPKRNHPILLAHGLAANRTTFDLTEEYSLARALAAQGYDVWCLELRGHGKSDRANMFAGRHFGWTVDDYFTGEIPLAIQHILEKTGQPRVHWIGHSLGGLLLYAMMARREDAKLRSGICIAGSIDYSASKSQYHMFAKLKAGARWVPAGPIHWLTNLTAPFTQRFKNSLEAFNYWQSNTPDRPARILQANNFHPVSSGVLIQMASLFEGGGFKSADGKVRYIDGVPQSKLPVFALAGDEDRQCPADAVKLGFEHVASPDKQYKCYGIENGEPDHYGHFDLIIGKRAKDEVYPDILKWLADHDAPA